VAAAMTLADPALIAVATHPVRAAILDAMREPSTAAAVARVPAAYAHAEVPFEPAGPLSR
jgi:hypothetical protein